MKKNWAVEKISARAKNSKKFREKFEKLCPVHGFWDETKYKRSHISVKSEILPEGRYEAKDRRRVLRTIYDKLLTEKFMTYIIRIWSIFFRIFFRFFFLKIFDFFENFSYVSFFRKFFQK